MRNFIQVTPFINVASLDEALAFFCDLLGFEVRYRMDDYAYVHRETVGVRLFESAEDVAARPGDARFAYYVDVLDVDALYAELKPRLDALPSDRVQGPLDQPYGQRELVLLAPDGNLIVFGQLIAPATASGTNRVDFVGRNLRGSSFAKVRLADATFHDVDLSAAAFGNVNASAATFENANLREARFTNVDLSNVEISRARLAGMRIDGILVTDLIAAYRAT
jgi:catechol 2,3-dioxygenase-like lactoylglutathione lyase family enzyme